MAAGLDLSQQQLGRRGEQGLPFLVALDVLATLGVSIRLGLFDFVLNCLAVAIFFLLLLLCLGCLAQCRRKRATVLGLVTLLLRPLRLGSTCAASLLR